MKSHSWPTCLLVMLMMSFVNLGCLDTIQIDLPQRSKGRLVVDGYVKRTANNYHFKTVVSRTQESSDPTRFNVIPTSILVYYNSHPIFDLQNDQEVVIDFDDFHNTYGGAAGTGRFKILVTVDGLQYASEEQRLLSSPDKGELHVNVRERDELNLSGNITSREYIELMINTGLVNDDQRKVSLSWEIKGVYEFVEQPAGPAAKTCYIDDPGRTNDINLVVNSEVNGNEISRFKINEDVADWRFWSGYYYTVVQNTLDERAAQYWKEIKLGNEREGTIFDVPPGKATTNIYPLDHAENEVLGFFFASEVDTIRKFVSNDEAGNQSHLCHSEYLPACDNCLLLFHSSLEKPKYW